jgi:predicted DNA-binding WGR domain protein
MRSVRLRRRDPGRNMDRFYSLLLRRTLFGDHVVTREWGRIGRSGTVREEWFPDEASATANFERHTDVRRARGYRPE